MFLTNLKYLTLILPIVSLSIFTGCVKNKSETVAEARITSINSNSSPEKPNIIINVKRQSGVCPQTVGIWTFMLPFEGGAEHTAVADIPINTRVVASGNKFVEYEAELRQSYKSCVGSAKSERPDVYNFQFRNGKVYFRLDLSKETLKTEITYKGIGGFRPYVRWIAGE
ncbi:hypothetical protein DSM106972_033770 [Dulcicalothrix desertica PCC 7102]|uniref:Lipoprotein n=1 Tax=Dulcicalothrix desertica PCC 7102 TaxID=232991 RepID=A0A3S1CN95_9CYAN|nr:hypothetical protein [Dulcicalothrix desertica]RUT06171.1 hypothetical protein DSM106972_033770 [Dulcicalothrix desertica PCC 7102]TWH54171.1 hypothetical protein CAL7102_02182 [Dulcicalothrix desertica PCC 7102]